MESVPSPMHVLCPSCATGYEIATLVRPRRLRCARCGAEWRELPPGADAAQDPGLAGAATPAPATTEPGTLDPAATGATALGATGPEERDAMSTRPPRRPERRIAFPPLRLENALLPGLWILSLAVMALALFAFWHWRAAIGHRWPPSVRLYRLLPGWPHG